jgi:hypothetical protein|tara:strand:+ start:905 stop:1054 length:150 start_codon:yes stop_codon:yes gene_type:complete
MNCPKCNNELTPTRDLDTMNCTHCGVTVTVPVPVSHIVLNNDNNKEFLK